MNNLLSYSKRFVKKNASTILTTIGGTGVVITSVMAVKAIPKALKMLEKAKEEKGEELTNFEIVKTAGLAYIPATVTGIAIHAEHLCTSCDLISEESCGEPVLFYDEH